MTRLEQAIERLRALPEAEQEMLAGEIEGGRTHLFAVGDGCVRHLTSS